MTPSEMELKEKKREKENVLKEWSKDVVTVSNKKKFDETSPKGQKILQKIANKYALTLIEIEDEIEELEQKIAKGE